MFVAALTFALHALQVSAASRPAAAAIAYTNLFDTSSEVTVLPGGMMVTSPGVRMVMLMKRAEDGTLVMQCVTSADAADAFLHPDTRAGAQKPQDRSR